MTQATVVTVGTLPAERLSLEHLVSEFGWSLESAADVTGLQAISFRSRVVAVLFSPDHLSLAWEEALEGILDAAPGALPIICHRIGEPIDWPLAAEAGAFHSLAMPFSEREVRQSLGFAWSADFRSTISRRLVRRSSGELTKLVPAELMAEVA